MTNGQTLTIQMTVRQTVTRISLWTWILANIATEFDSSGIEPHIMNIRKYAHGI